MKNPHFPVLISKLDPKRKLICFLDAPSPYKVWLKGKQRAYQPTMTYCAGVSTTTSNPGDNISHSHTSIMGQVSNKAMSLKMASFQSPHKSCVLHWKSITARTPHVMLTPSLTKTTPIITSSGQFVSSKIPTKELSGRDQGPKECLSDSSYFRWQCPCWRIN